LISDKVVDTSQGMNLAFEYGMNFFETSAKTNINVIEAFTCLAKIVKRRLMDVLPPEPLETFQLYYERKNVEENLIEFLQTSCLPTVLHSIIRDYYISDNLSDYYSSSISTVLPPHLAVQLSVKDPPQPKRKDSTCIIM